MLPMRDGTRMQFDVYRPKGAGRVPAIFVRTPYNMNYWDVRLGAPADMTAQLAAVTRGYAYVAANERGHFFSEGNYDILGAPVTDGVDEIRWISSQPWSNGKVGLLGYSSTAEWQMAVAAQAPPGNTSQADLVRAARAYDLAEHLPPVDWKAAFWHLPVQDMIQAHGGPHGIFADSMPGIATGGAMIKRTPNDPAWYRGGLFTDSMKINVPGLWFMSWYDVSVGPNLATYNHVRRTADPAVAAQQYAVLAPTLHCAYTRATENTSVGERNVGDARLDYNALTYGWFDTCLKGEHTGLLDTLPRVRYYTMGLNKWQTSDTWPPRGAQPVTFYLTSRGKANARHGDGGLAASPPSTDMPDRFTYDPMRPVMSNGGNVCCQANALTGGALDQQKAEENDGVLVYSTPPLADGMEVSGPIQFTTYVSSDRKDTDVTVKLIDVYPDGRAYNLDETIQRLHYRDGYDAPVAWMQAGRVYKVALQPMTTSNYFEAGHRLRIEVSSSDFPRSRAPTCPVRVPRDQAGDLGPGAIAARPASGVPGAAPGLALSPVDLVLPRRQVTGRPRPAPPSRAAHADRDFALLSRGAPVRVGGSGFGGCPGGRSPAGRRGGESHRAALTRSARRRGRVATCLDTFDFQGKRSSWTW